MKWKVRDWTTRLRSKKLDLQTLRENHESQEHFFIHTHDMNDQAQLSVKKTFACVISLLILLTLMILLPLLMCTMWWYINFISNLHLYYIEIFIIYLILYANCIYYALFHADVSLQRGFSIRRRHITGGSAAIPHPEGQQRTCKYTIMHDVLFLC